MNESETPRTYNKFLETNMYEYIKLHYPEDCMIFGNKIGRIRTDITILDSLGNEVAVLELKVSRGLLKVAEKSGLMTLLKMREEINIPLYLIIADADEYGVSEYLVYKLDNNNNLEKIDSLPSYEMLLAGTKAKIITKEKVKQEKKIGTIHVFSWIIIVLGIIILILDAFHIYAITPNRMWFMLGLVLIFLVPNITELTIGNFNLKMLQKENNEQKDKDK